METLQFVPYSNLSDGRTILLLELPEERDSEYDFWQTDNTDYAVRDAQIRIDVRSFRNALAAYLQHLPVFESVSISIEIDSDSFEGKIRNGKLNIKTFGMRDIWTSAEFVNDWSHTRYEFDTDNCWPVPRTKLLGYLETLL